MDLAPFRGRRNRNLARFHDAVNDLFGRFLEEWPPLAGETAWAPLLDVAEREDAVVVKAEVPGVKPDDIDISVHGNTLTISGQKKEETDKSDGDYYHMERHWGEFRRSITLATEVDADKIDATCKEGVLTITLPKAEKAKPKKIKVKQQ